MFYTRFLSPADHKCAESSAYWQFFYYRPPGKFRWTSVNHFDKHREISLKCDAKNISLSHSPPLSPSLSLYIYVYIYITLWRIGSWRFWWWLVMFVFVDLKWPRVFRCSTPSCGNWVVINTFLRSYYTVYVYLLLWYFPTIAKCYYGICV